MMGKHKKTIRPIVDKFKQLGIKKVAPSHCAGKNTANMFKEEYHDNFIEPSVGKIINTRSAGQDRS